MRISLSLFGLLAASSAHASLPSPPTNVPELSAVGATAAIAGIAAALALVRERSRRKDD